MHPKFHVARAADLRASPVREDTGVKNIAFVFSFACRRGAKREQFAKVARRGIEAAVGRGSERRDLCCRGFEQIAVVAAGPRIDGKDVAAIAGTGEQASPGVESESVHDV